MIGRTVGRFPITTALGRGGMASVWRADDPLLSRPVAIKLLSEELARDPDARQRFLREARDMARLGHPGVPAVYDVGEADGLTYFAMSFIDGETLSARAASSPMPIDEAIRILVAAARVIDYAHHEGVVHRDISGRNIMVARDGRVFVLDFGLALAAWDSRITSSSTVLGTAHYMAPEVFEGKSATPLSDLYGLGVVLYEALTGYLPFGDLPGRALPHARDLRPTPVHALRPEVPAELEAIVMKAIARNPEERFPDVAAFAAALLALAPFGEEGTAGAADPRPAAPFNAAPDSQEATWPRRWVKRGPAMIAVLPFEDVGTVSSAEGGRSLLAQGLSEALGAALSRLSDVQVIPASAARSTAGAHEDPQLIARRVGANLLLRGSVRGSGSDLRVTWEILDPWRRVQVAGETVEGRLALLFELEDALAASVCRALGVEEPVGLGHPPRGAPRDPAAHEHYLQALGHLQRRDNEASIDGAIGLLERLVASEGSSAPVQAALGRACLEKYRMTAARQWESRAALACEQALKLDARAPEVLATLGEVHLAAGRHEEAIREFDQALVLRPELAEALLGRPRALEAIGRTAEAEAACRHAIALRPDDWRTHSQLGSLYFNQGRYEDALELFRRVIQLTPDNARAHTNLGSTYHRLDRLDEALAAYRRSIHVQPTARALMNLGTVLFYLERYPDAAEAYEKAASLGPADPMPWGSLGSARRWIPGQTARAAEALERAVAVMQERLERNPRHAQGWAWLSAWLANLRRDAEAVAAIERAIELAPHDVTCMAVAGTVYHFLGNRPLALKWFREAVARGYGVEKLRRDPELAPLREDPEFIRILEQGSAPRGPGDSPNTGGAA